MSTVISAPDRTGFDVVRAVSGFAPHFRQRRPITDAERSVPVASMQELSDAGVLRMLVPKVFGGLELSITDFVDATAAAAAGCPSTGWCAGQMAFATLVFASAPFEVQQTIWATTPDVRSASIAAGLTAIPAPGGFVLSGKGPFASGINHAQWLYLGAPIMADGKVQELRFFFVNKDQVGVLDTWDTSAMRGTGSNTVVVDNVFVPEAFSVRHADLREGSGPGSVFHQNPMYSLPWVAVVPLIYGSTMLGATRAAYEEMVQSLRAKVTPGGLRSADSEELQLEVSMVGAKIDGAALQLHAMAARADSGLPYTVRERAMAMRNASFLALQLVEAIDAVLAISGTAGFSDTSFIQQAWGDVHFASAHQALNKRSAGSRFGRMELDVVDAVLPVFY